MNRRSPSRIIALANDIRSESDQQEQYVMDGKGDGLVRFYIAQEGIGNKPDLEKSIREDMANHSGDDLWRNPKEVKHLMLEHMMVASRMGFSEMYSALRMSKSLITGLNSGELPAVRFFFRIYFSSI